MSRFSLGVLLATTSWVTLHQPADAQLWQTDCERIEANGGVAACGDIEADRDINIGPTPEQIQNIVRDTLRQESLTSEEASRLQAKVDRLGAEIGVRSSAVENFLRILNEQNVPLKQLGVKLDVIARRHKNLLAGAAHVRSGGPEVQQLHEETTEAIKAGDYGLAEQKLGEARQALQAAGERLQMEVTENKLAQASIEGELGKLRLAELRYLDAADHFSVAAGLVPVSEDLEHAAYLAQQASALQDHGDEKGDNDALLLAIKVYVRILAIRTRERVPLQWARTQNNLGTTLWTLSCSPFQVAGMDDLLLVEQAFQYGCRRAKQEARS